MTEPHADGYDEGEDDALVQSSAVLTLNTSLSLLLSLHPILLLLLTITFILQHGQNYSTHTTCSLWFDREVCVRLHG